MLLTERVKVGIRQQKHLKRKSKATIGTIWIFPFPKCLWISPIVNLELDPFID